MGWKSEFLTRNYHPPAPAKSLIRWTRGRSRSQTRDWARFEYGKLVAVGDRQGEFFIPRVWLSRLEETWNPGK